MPTLAEQIAADKTKVEEHRAQFGDAAAADLDAKLYLLRRTPSTGYLAAFPKWIVILIALWVAALETADKLPQLLLSYPRYEAALAEAKAKIMQPDLVKAQLDKAVNDATTAKYAALAAPTQPDLAKAQLTKTKNEAAASEYQPVITVYQQEKAKQDATIAAVNASYARAVGKYP